MRDIRELLKGAYDLHIHLGPSVIPRSIDMIDALAEADACGMAGLVAKDHQTPTTTAAILTNTHHKGPNGCEVFSSIVLNSFVGGLNPDALNVAIALGARFVWLPTISSENHDVQHKKHGLWFPSSTVKERPEHPKQYIYLLDESGKPTRALRTILEIVADTPQLVLCTGHGTLEEVDAAITLALELGCTKIIATHPGYMIGADHATMRDWASKGVFIDIGVGTCDPTLPHKLGTVEDAVGIIRAVGSEHMVLTSDLGQKVNPKPVPGMIGFIGQLMEHGVTENEIVNMIRINPGKLLQA
jgi:Glycine/serine hydroxymethyltransferase